MASIGDGRTTPTTSRPAHSPLPTNGNFYRLLKRQFCPLNYRGGGIQWSAWPCVAVYSSRLVSLLPPFTIRFPLSFPLCEFKAKLQIPSLTSTPKTASIDRNLSLSNAGILKS
ncbi:hypothetical protein AAC387_Pa01g0867 [Persea americana]